MSEKPCVLCNHTTDDALEFGEKLTCEDTTAHLYCLLLTSNLVQHGEDNEGIYGFLPKDIKSEVWRTKKLLCCYCHQKSATIGCCVKACRRSFHLPCALQNDCQLEFNDTFRSFCEDHLTIKKPKHIHQSTDLCTICFDEMGQFNLMRSIPLPCCNKNAWCHKNCLQKYAQTSGYFLKCPLCKDSDQFRQWIQERGVFIPDRDAKWEVDETGPNTFYDFEQHNERPSECVAKVCKCTKGRRYHVDSENSRYALEYCHYCGSKAAHIGCLNTKEFRCDGCEEVLIRMPETVNSSVMIVDDCEIVRPTNSRNSMGNGRNARLSRGSNARRTRFSTSSACSSIVEIGSDTDERFGKYLVTQNMIDKFKLRECSVRLTRLTSKDFLKMSVSTDTELCSKDRKLPFGESSSEEEIKPMIRMKRKSTTIFESDTDSDINFLRVRTANTLRRNHITDTDSDQQSCKMDTDDNSNSLPISNRVVKLKNPFEWLKKTQLDGLRARQISSSEEEIIRPARASFLIRKFFQSDDSDEQMNGKENTKPIPSVAIVHPFPMTATATTTSSSADEMMKTSSVAIVHPFSMPVATTTTTTTKMSTTIKISSSSSSDEMIKIPMSASSRPRILSSDSDNPHKSTITQRYDYLKNVALKQNETPMNGQENDPSKPLDVGIKTEPTTPNKRKYRTVRSYFRETSSSDDDDELMEPKPKRKTPKKTRKIITNFERPSNQATIMQFFKKHFDPDI